jgi:hypothetical protein
MYDVYALLWWHIANENGGPEMIYFTKDICMKPYLHT